MLSYRLPREPSRPRLAVWRAIRRLGVLQLGDGLVALPASARNAEHFQWIAADIAEHSGTATVWHATTDTAREHDEHVATMRGSADDAYRVVLEETRRALADRVPAVERRRIVRRARNELRRIGLRDYFDAPSGRLARAAVDRLAKGSEVVET
jgi:hypothetical protein